MSGAKEQKPQAEPLRAEPSRLISRKKEKPENIAKEEGENSTGNAKENSEKKLNSQAAARRRVVKSRKKKEPRKESKKELKLSSRGSYKKLHLGKNGKKLVPGPGNRNLKLMEEYQKVIGKKHIPPKKQRPKAKRIPDKVDKFLFGKAKGKLPVLKAPASKSDMTKESIEERKERKKDLKKTDAPARERLADAFVKKPKTASGDLEKIVSVSGSERESKKVPKVREQLSEECGVHARVAREVVQFRVDGHCA